MTKTLAAQMMKSGIEVYHVSQPRAHYYMSDVDGRTVCHEGEEFLGYAVWSDLPNNGWNYVWRNIRRSI